MISDLIADPLVGLEVESELVVVPLNDDLGGLLTVWCERDPCWRLDVVFEGGIRECEEVVGLPKISPRSWEMRNLNFCVVESKATS